jgi:RNA polymerase sigma-70 factor, ECF subfamily
MSRSETEASLVARAKRGDPLAFERLFTPHIPMLEAYGRIICGDFHLAQDVVQETGLIAYRHLDRLFADADFATWLKAIVRRRAIHAREKKARMPSLPPRVSEAMEEAYVDPTPGSHGPQAEALGRCLKVLEEHDERSARALHSFYFEGSPVARIAELLGANLNTVKALLYRARLKLQGCVERRLRGSHA